MASVSSRSFTQHVLSFPSAHSPQAATNASSSCPPAFHARSAYSLPKRRAQIHASRVSVVGGCEKLGTGFRGSRIGLGSGSERSAELQQLRQGAESGSAVNMITWNRELLFNVLLPLGGGLIASAFAAPNLSEVDLIPFTLFLLCLCGLFFPCSFHVFSFLFTFWPL
jgi:hypothetical protein